MKNILILLACLFLFSKNVQGQKTAAAVLDPYFHQVLKKGAAPGFSVVVVRADQVIFSKGYGVEKAGLKKAMTAETSTAIGSLTKSFTALAMMQLVEQDCVRLDDPVVKYLPGFRTANRERSDEITVRMLLNNTSGLPGSVTQNFTDAANPLEQYVASLQSVFLPREPGSAYEYSNPGFSVAGLIISHVSGMSYPEYLETQIFRPLGMRCSTTDPADFEAFQVLYGHHPGLSGGIPAGRGFESEEMAPAGSLLRSTANDLGNYLVALLNGGSYGNRKILTPKSIGQMWSPQINFPGLSREKGGDGKDYHYGLGWMISEVEGRTVIHHGGSTGTMASMTILDPERRLGASILLNLDHNFVDPYRFRPAFNILLNAFQLLENEKFTNIGIPRIPDPTLNNYELPESLTQRFTGKYRFAGSGNAWDMQGAYMEIFSGPNGQPQAKITRGATLLQHFSLDFTNEANAVSRNIAAPQNVHFKVRPDGSVTGLYFSGAEFKKLPPDFLEKYRLVTLSGSPVSFYFPEAWEVKTQGGSFEAYKKGMPGTSVSGGLTKPELFDFQKLIGKKLPGHQVLGKGLEMTETRGSQLWRQQSFTTIANGKKFQHLLLFNKTRANGSYFLLTTPEGKLTATTQEVVSILMETFSSL